MVFVCICFGRLFVFVACKHRGPDTLAVKHGRQSSSLFQAVWMEIDGLQRCLAKVEYLLNVSLPQSEFNMPDMHGLADPGVLALDTRLKQLC